MSASFSIPAITAFLVAWIFTAIVLCVAKRTNIVDYPNFRSSHSVPTPRGGGLSIVIVVLGELLLISYWHSPPSGQYLLFGSAAAVAAIGLADDFANVSACVRLFVHLLAASAIAYIVTMAGSADGGKFIAWDYLVFAIVVVGIGWVVNLFNFMDGIDGIAASEAIFISLSGAGFLYWAGNDYWAALCLVVAAASAAFLTFNWSPARIFLGDVGSGFLGFILGSIAALSWSDGYLSPVVWAILGGAFLVDATYTLIVRVFTGQQWLSAHRSHVYQKLARKYDSHVKVTAIYAGTNIVWLLPCAWLANRNPSVEWWIALFALAPVCVAAIHFRGGISGPSSI